MARAAAAAVAHTVTAVSPVQRKSFGRPAPVICDDEQPWFDAVSAAAEAPSGYESARRYIRQRFADLLPEEDIQALTSNEVMLQIVVQHRATFLANQAHPDQAPAATPVSAAAAAAPVQTQAQAA